MKDKGYLNFIVPSSWTSPTSDSWDILKDKKIIVINSSEYLRDFFPSVGSTFSYFLVQKTKSDDENTIYYDKNNMFLNIFKLKTYY